MSKSFDEQMQAAAALYTSGRLVEAAAAFAHLAKHWPLNPHVHANLGVTLSRQGKFDAAVAAYRRALVLMPDNATILANLGNTLRAQGKPEEAAMVLSRAFLKANSDPSISLSVALALRDVHRPKDALSILQRLLAAQPQNPEFEWNLALTHLQMGNYVDGFRAFEARWKLPRAQKAPPRHGPQWAGDNLEGRHVIVQVEPGYRDAIQFARFVPLLAKRGARIIMECSPELSDLFLSLEGVEDVIAIGTRPPSFDVTVPLLSLPMLLKTTLQDLPASPYLSARSPLSLERPEGLLLRVGLVWAGRPGTPDRSWPLARLMPLFEEPGFAFFSLQKGPQAALLAASGLDNLVTDLGPQLKTFADTAAAIRQLDILISVDAAAAHLAGAMGWPTWTLLRQPGDWRWLDSRGDSPWYPTMRLFWQSKSDDFVGPVTLVRAELERLAQRAKAGVLTTSHPT